MGHQGKHRFVHKQCNYSLNYASIFSKYKLTIDCDQSVHMSGNIFSSFLAITHMPLQILIF